jgi:hypothetical protein
VVAIDFVVRGSLLGDRSVASMGGSSGSTPTDGGARCLVLAESSAAVFSWPDGVAETLLLPVLLLLALRLVLTLGARDLAVVDPPSKAASAVLTSSEGRLRQQST